MKVGLNLLYMIPGMVGGVQTYAEGLLEGLGELNNGNEYIVFLNRQSATLKLPRGFRREVLAINAHSRAARYVWEQCRLPAVARRHCVDVLHSLGYVGPIRVPCAAVVTVHDLNFVRLRSQMSYVRQWGLGFFSRRSAARSQRVITVSEFSRRELCSELRLDPNRVSVVYHGSPSGGSTLALESELRELPELPVRFIVAFTGRGEPHKNIVRLIEAFHVGCHDMPHRLVLIGKPTPELMAHFTSRVLPLGYLPADGVRDVLRRAELFVLPSLYEGFGFPVLEAQRAGIPVVCSEAASLPEIGGDAAVYFPPASVTAMAEAIRATLRDDDRKRRLVELGYHNVQRFSWKNAARQTVDVYRDALQLWRAEEESD